MPLFEMPLDELRVYRGRNPRPADFDEYWERALAEAAAVDPAPVFQPTSFEGVVAECSDLWFTGVGGARVHARFWQPAAGQPPTRPCSTSTATAGARRT
ncbi:MAG: acetylxylan esterase, partial [Candidatus Dormiibacterota bacterium]